MSTVQDIKIIAADGLPGRVMSRALWHRGTIYTVQLGVLAIAVFFCIGIIGAGRVMAQQNDSPEFVEHVMGQIERLSNDIAGIQQRLAGGDTVGGDAVAGWSPANHESRLSELEQQIRELTGKIEEASHSVAQTIETLNSLTDDLQARLPVIEERLSSIQQSGTVLETRSSAAEQEGRTDETLAAVDKPSLATIVGKDPNMNVYESMEVLGEITSGETVDARSSGDPSSLPKTDPVARGEEEMTADALYKAAQDLLLKKRDYVSAEKLLRSFVAQYPEHSLTGNAYYWLGETYYVRNNYGAAAKAFLQGYTEFPEGVKAPDNLLKLGLSLKAAGIESGDNSYTGEACKVFGKLLNNQPDAPAVIVTRVKQEWAKAACS